MPINRLHSIEEELRQHEALITLKGYTENSLNSREHQGQFTRAIRGMVGKCIADNSNQEDPIRFYLTTTGYFDADRVLYKFQYQFDPVNARLDILDIEARLGKEKIKILINKNSKLPSAVNLYSKLQVKKRHLQFSGVKTAQFAKMTQAIHQFTAFLKVFDEHTAVDRVGISDELNTRLREIALKPHAKPEHVLISRAIRLTDIDTVHCLFHFTYDDRRNNLHLQSLTTRKGSKVQTIDLQSRLHPDNAGKIIDELRRSNNIPAARVLLDTNVSKSMKRRV